MPTAYANGCLENINWVLKYEKKILIVGKAHKPPTRDLTFARSLLYPFTRHPLVFMLTSPHIILN